MRILFVLLLGCNCIVNTFSQTTKNEGELKGVITYLFNNYQGDKPDIGAKVRIWPLIPKSDSLIDKFIEAKTYQNLYNTASVEDKSRFMNKLIQLNCETKAKFDTLDKKIAIRNILLNRNKDLITLIVDGVGNYSVKLPKGNYEILVTSKGRTGLSLTEIGGKIAHGFITIQPDQQTFFNYRFNLY